MLSFKKKKKIITRDLWIFSVIQSKSSYDYREFKNGFINWMEINLYHFLDHISRRASFLEQ